MSTTRAAQTADGGQAANAIDDPTEPLNVLSLHERLRDVVDNIATASLSDVAFKKSIVKRVEAAMTQIEVVVRELKNREPDRRKLLKKQGYYSHHQKVVPGPAEPWAESGPHPWLPAAAGSAGTRVVVTGLTASPHVNGRRGIVRGAADKPGRVAVLLDGDAKLTSIREVNLHTAHAATQEAGVQQRWATKACDYPTRLAGHAQDEVPFLTSPFWDIGSCIRLGNSGVPCVVLEGEVGPCSYFPDAHIPDFARIYPVPEGADRLIYLQGPDGPARPLYSHFDQEFWDAGDDTEDNPDFTDSEFFLSPRAATQLYVALKRFLSSDAIASLLSPDGQGAPAGQRSGAESMMVQFSSLRCSLALQEHAHEWDLGMWRQELVHAFFRVKNRLTKGHTVHHDSDHAPEDFGWNQLDSSDVGGCNVPQFHWQTAGWFYAGACLSSLRAVGDFAAWRLVRRWQVSTCAATHSLTRLWAVAPRCFEKNRKDRNDDMGWKRHDADILQSAQVSSAMRQSRRVLPTVGSFSDWPCIAAASTTARQQHAGFPSDDLLCALVSGTMLVPPLASSERVLVLCTTS